MNENNNGFRGKCSVFFERNGFYVVLMLCLAVVGATAFFTFSRTEGEALPETPLEVRQSDDQTIVQALSTPLPQVTLTAEPTPTPMPQKASPPVSASAPKSSKALYDAPVKGEVILPFANDALVYSRTLNQWTSHTGIDIKAEAGTAVKSMAAGKVQSVAEDPLMGYTITIKHNGAVSTYANLNELPGLAEGDTVKKGDAIGRVGQSAINECEDDAHLHFELRIDGKLVNPGDHLIGVTELEEMK